MEKPLVCPRLKEETGDCVVWMDGWMDRLFDTTESGKVAEKDWQKHAMGKDRRVGCRRLLFVVRWFGCWVFCRKETLVGGYFPRSG